jgi:SsrA-binding protein
MKQISIKNKKAFFNYELIERITAGLVLKGTEIKSIREGKADLNEAFCVIVNDELFVRGMHISPYKFGTHTNHIAKADRKLLVNKKELKKWESKTKEKGFTIIPIKLFINEHGYAKLEIGLGKGKKTHDKRESLKQKDAKLEIGRIKSGKY